jgi:hypothetical protein
MIEKLFEENSITTSDLRYQQAMEDILQAEDALIACLAAEDRQRLTNLTDAYARRENILLENAFVNGFRAAAELALELIYGKKN